MSLQSCNSLMRALGAEFGIPELALDEQRCCALAVDAVVVNFEFDEQSELLFLYANLGPVPDMGASVLFERLLEGNLMGRETAGATLSLDRLGQRVVLHQGLSAQQMSDTEFIGTVEKFVDVAEVWTRQVSETAARDDGESARGPASTLSPDLLA